MPTKGDPDGLAQHRGGGADVRPHPDLRGESRPRQRRDPGRLPQPRNRLDPAFRQLVDQIYARMTASAGDGRRARARQARPAPASRLPRLGQQRLAGLIERWPSRPITAGPTCRSSPRTLQMEIDDLFPMVETLQLLGFADVAEATSS